MQVPYATLFTLMKNGGMEKEAAHEAASIAQFVNFPDTEEALATVKQFIELHAIHPANAMALLNGALELSQKEPK
jgi:hypothetical protein